MPSTLVAYGTGEGQTAAVAERVADALAERGHDVTVVDLAADGGSGDGPAVRAFDAVLVASPVRNRRHLPAVTAFVEANRAALAARPTGLVQLSVASALPWRRAREGPTGSVEDLVERTGWRPDRVALVAGALRDREYDPLTRLAFRLVAAVTTGDADASRDYEYTDRDDVDEFGAAFASYVEGYLDGRSGAAAEERPGRDATVPDAPVGEPSGASRSLAVVGLLAGALAVLLWLVVRGRHRGW
jgi:menaquinone-dependent protoporphyrinogen oxidase